MPDDFFEYVFDTLQGRFCIQMSNESSEFLKHVEVSFLFVFGMNTVNRHLSVYFSTLRLTGLVTLKTLVLAALEKKTRTP